VPLKTLRRQVTVIPQDPTLFTGTLRFNLDPDSRFSDDFLVSVLRKAGLYRILRTSEQGLLQPITEGGQNFSAGERQLLCICRAILRKSRLVIMDEATAFIDMITEQKVQELIS
jgi:ABC-type multidrug transport system fused ATPase/permease subunit